MAKVKLLTFNYAPGDEWSCGHLNLTAETPLGLFEWKQVVPGPRHGDDSAELTVTLAGHELEDCEGLDFEPPNKEGKWSKLFKNSQDDVEKTLQAWYELSEPELRELVLNK